MKSYLWHCKQMMIQRKRIRSWFKAPVFLIIFITRRYCECILCFYIVRFSFFHVLQLISYDVNTRMHEFSHKAIKLVIINLKYFCILFKKSIGCNRKWRGLILKFSFQLELNLLGIKTAVPTICQTRSLFSLM